MLAILNSWIRKNVIKEDGFFGGEERENKSEDRKPLSEHPGSDLGNVTNIFGSWDQAGAMTGEERVSQPRPSNAIYIRP